MPSVRNPPHAGGRGIPDTTLNTTARKSGWSKKPSARFTAASFLLSSLVREPEPGKTFGGSFQQFFILTVAAATAAAAAFQTQVLKPRHTKPSNTAPEQRATLSDTNWAMTSRSWSRAQGVGAACQHRARSASNCRVIKLQQHETIRQSL